MPPELLAQDPVAWLRFRGPFTAVWQLEGSETCKQGVLRDPVFCGVANEELSEKPLVCLLQTRPD